MSAPSRATTRRQKRLELKAQDNIKQQSVKAQHFDLRPIKPMTANQRKTFEAYEDGFNLFLHGSPGVGKSFLGIYLSLREILNTRSDYKKLVIVRSAQASKNIGFLPGDEKKKLEVYEAPYRGICNELFGRGDAYDVLKQKGIVEFQSTSFLRGTTIDDAIILIDEAQNSSYMELKTVLTRAGNDSKVIVCGDMNQDDLTSTRYNEVSGISSLKKVFDRIPSIHTIEFGVEDIVRSGFVRSFIIAEGELA